MVTCISDGLRHYLALFSPEKNSVFQKYINWMKHLKVCLGRYNQKRLDGFENKLGLSILKLIDGGLYMRCSIQLKRRVNKVGFNIKI